MGNVASQHSQDAGRSDLFVLDHIRSSPHLQEKARHCQNYGVDEDSLLHKLAEACELTSETIVEVIKEFSPGLNALKVILHGLLYI